MKVLPLLTASIGITTRRGQTLHFGTSAGRKRHLRPQALLALVPESRIAVKRP